MLGLAGRSLRDWTIAALASLLIVGGAAVSPAQGFSTGPIAVQAPLPLTGRVVDAANVLAPDLETKLTVELKRLETDTKVRFVVATTPSLGHLSIKQYGMALGNGWGLGDKVRNDGLILLIAPVERKVRIEVGLGLAARLPDAYCATVVRHMLPRFRDGKFGEGVQIGVDELAAQVRRTTFKAAA